MKKFFIKSSLVLTIFVGVIVLGFTTMPLIKAEAQSMTYSQMIELFISLGIIPADQAASARTTVTQVQTVPLYRLYNSASGGYLFTASEEELRSASTFDIFRPQGITGYIYKTQATGTTPVYRFFSPITVDHFYTISPSERDTLKNSPSWNDEGIAGYLNTAQVNGTLPITRLYNSLTGIHLYTTSQAEINQKVKAGWTNEGLMGAYIAPGKTMPLAPEGLYGSCSTGSTLAALAWGPTVNADSYKVQLSTTTNPWAKVSTNSYTFTGTASTTYPWWVSACNSAGCSDSSVGPVFTCASSTVAPTATGTLSILTFPGSATTTLDGVVKGLTSSTTPLIIRNLSVGWHTLLFTKAGYDNLSTNTSISARSTTTVSYTLKSSQDSPVVQKIPLYRLYNSLKQSYLYTSSEAEKDQTTTYSNWKYQGIAGYIYPTQVTGTTPVYRLFYKATGDHLYTINTSERDSVKNARGWSDEGIAGYLNTTQVQGTLPLTRLYNGKTGIHFYATSQTEIDQKVKAGWTNEGPVGAFITPGNISLTDSTPPTPPAPTAQTTPPAPTTSNFIKIMPIGDSITEMRGASSSYRYWLWNKLQSAGFTNIDFVGPQADTAILKLNNYHAGWGGMTADWFLGDWARLPLWAPMYKPDIALIHIGINDYHLRYGLPNPDYDTTLTTTIDDIDNMVDTLRSANPSIKIIVAQIIPSILVPDNELKKFNAELARVVPAKSTTNSPIYLVDMHTWYNQDIHSTDKVHPNDLGSQFMSDRWFEVLKNILPLSEIPNPPANSQCIFNYIKYANYYPDLKKAFGYDEAKLKNHWLQSGIKEGRTPCGADMPTCKADSNNYLTIYPDVANSGLDPLVHYKKWGINEGRAVCKTTPILTPTVSTIKPVDLTVTPTIKPVTPTTPVVVPTVTPVTITKTCVFNAKKYADFYPDLKTAFGYDEAKLKSHWLNAGIKEGRTPCGADMPTCKANANNYLTIYPDVANAGMDPLVHYTIFGINEGRAVCKN